MAQKNVDVVRSQFEATNRRDGRLAMSYYAEDVVLVIHPDAFLEGGTFEGRDAVGQWFGDWFRSFEPGYHFDLEELRDLGDVVFLDASHFGRGRASGVEVRGRTAYLYTVRDGKIVRAELFAGRDEALAAAGMSA